MKPTIPLLAIGMAAIVLATPASAQLGSLTVTAGMPDTSEWSPTTKAPELKKCDKPATRIGWWRRSGSVAFTIDSAGRIDTATVMVVTSSSSEAGIESYARRLLAGCSWQPARVDGRKSTVIVRLQLPPEAEQSVVPGPFLPAPTEPGLYLRTSRKLEEVPRMISCPDPDIHGDGRVDLRFIVGTDGHVEPESVVVSTDTESLANAFAIMRRGCVYQPGRIGGEPVRTLYSESYSVTSLVPVDRVEVRTTTRP